MALKNWVIFLALSLSNFSSKFGLKASLFSQEKIHIEISSGKIKNTTFAISCNNEAIGNKIAKNLESTSRFKQIKCNINMANMQNLGVDMFIKILFIENGIEVEIYDVMQKKALSKFKIKAKNWSENQFENILKKIINKISNEIYTIWFNEPGLFETSLIFINDITNELSILSQKNYGKDQILTKSSPISYLNSIIWAQNRIFLTKFCTKKRGFSIFSYIKENKQFFRLLSIEQGNVFAPAIFQNKLYVSASNNGTTGVYEISLENRTKDHEFKNFKEFEKDQNNSLIIKVPGKIATSINIYNDLAIYCSNQNGQPSLFKAKLINGKLCQHQQISKEAGYYEPALFMNKKVAAIKTSNGMFHLVVIDLANNEEKILISKYYISQPSWSPCGNWIACSARERGEKDKIIIIHKSGKYPQIIQNENNCKNPIWIENDNSKLEEIIVKEAINE